MKTLIYTSGIFGGLFLLLRLLGLFVQALNADILLYAGLGLFIFIFIPLSITYKRRQDQKIDKIIKSYKGKSASQLSGEKDNETKTRGWSMNNSPFRERRSGLNWGGGNVHAANAKRGRRRKFL